MRKKKEEKKRTQRKQKRKKQIKNQLSNLFLINNKIKMEDKEAIRNPYMNLKYSNS